MISVQPDQVFRFDDDVWTEIADAGGFSPDDALKRLDLEDMLDRFLRETPAEVRKKNRENSRKILKAAKKFLDVLYETHQDIYSRDGQSIGRPLAEMVADWEEIELEGGGYEPKPLQYDLCFLWRMHWIMPLGSSINPVTGEVGGPLIRFIVKVHEIVLGEKIRPHQARHAVRRAQQKLGGLTDEEIFRLNVFMRNGERGP
ncbi:MAG: hypothetical protein Devi2KO_37940 [Devosia indica]